MSAEELPEFEPEEVEPTALEALEKAIQRFVTETHDESGCESAALVDMAVVVWEAVCYDEDGTLLRTVNYTVPTQRSSLSGTIGLLDIGMDVVRNDIFPSED